MAEYSTRNGRYTCRTVTASALRRIYLSSKIYEDPQKVGTVSYINGPVIKAVNMRSFAMHEVVRVGEKNSWAKF